MQLRVPSWFAWLATAVGGVLIGALLRPAAEESTPAVWVRETGWPALESMAGAALASAWAPWAIAAVLVLGAVTASWRLSRRFLGRPRTPSEMEADLRLAKKCEEVAERLMKAANRYRSYKHERDQRHSRLLNSIGDKRGAFADVTRHEELSNNTMDALHCSVLASTAYSGLLASEFGRRRIKLDTGDVDRKRPEGADAKAQCLREVAAALRAGRYKGRTFKCGSGE